MGSAIHHHIYMYIYTSRIIITIDTQIHLVFKTVFFRANHL